MRPSRLIAQLGGDESLWLSRAAASGAGGRQSRKLRKCMYCYAASSGSWVTLDLETFSSEMAPAVGVMCSACAVPLRSLLVGDFARAMRESA